MKKNNQPLIIALVAIGAVLIISLALIFARGGDETPTETTGETDTASDETTTETTSETDTATNNTPESLETQTSELEAYDDKYVYATAEVYNHKDRKILARCLYSIGTSHGAVSPIALEVLQPGSNSVDELINARLVGAIDEDDGDRVSVEGLSLYVECSAITQEEFADSNFYGI